MKREDIKNKLETYKNEGFEKSKEMIKEKKGKIKKFAILTLTGSIVLAGIGAGTAFAFVKSNTKYSQEKLKEIALSKIPGEVVGVKKDIDEDSMSLTYEFKIKDKNNMLNEIELDSKTGAIIDIENHNEYKDHYDNDHDDKDHEDDIDYEQVKVKYFDLSLLKWVSQAIVVENGKENITNTGYNGHEDPEPVVKVELHKKKLNQVTVKFGYGITITNEGDIPGYAKEITDYVPEGLRFEAGDNPLWTDEGNNVISTKQLENTLLQPGESATVEVILTWINGPENLALKTNTAEISEDDNEYDVPDRDSTPDNRKEGEDDIDIAKVILAVSTGSVKTYFTLAIGLLAVVLVGIVIIKKFII